MKRALLSLLLLAALLLSGCSAMLNGSYVRVTPAEDRLSAGEDPSVIEVENRSDLISAILDLVRQGVEQGVVRLVSYSGDVEADLAAACLEVAQEDPLGAYAVESIKYDYTHVISYYEANIYLSYRRSHEQVASISRVTGSSAIRTELRAALLDFAPEVVLQVSYFAEDEESIRELVRQAYYETPIAALGMPGISVTLYPAETNGYQRIVEIQLAYAESADALREKSQQLADAAQGISVSLFSLPDDDALEQVHAMVNAMVSYVPEGSAPAESASCSTAWHALVEHQADSEGIALAVSLLCQRLEVESMVVSGTRDGQTHYWNIVRLSSGEFRHVDATRADGFSLSDADLVSQGYAWNREDGSIPLCGEQPPVSPEPQESAVPASEEGSNLEAAPDAEAPAEADGTAASGDLLSRFLPGL